MRTYRWIQARVRATLPKSGRKSLKIKIFKLGEFVLTPKFTGIWQHWCIKNKKEVGV